MRELEQNGQWSLPSDLFDNTDWYLPPPAINDRPGTAKNWCFTWNNYPDNADDLLRNAFRDAAAYAYQREMGEQQTPHIQGCIQFKTRIRPFTLGLPREIHWEACKGSWDQNVRYCTKADTRAADTNPTTYNCIVPREIEIIKDLRPWQTKVEALLLSKPDDRKIHWFWEPDGNVGKSAFIKYMAVKHGCIVRGSDAKKADLINLAFNAFSNSQKTSLVIDLPRGCRGALAFAAIEDIKNGYITNSKYETGELAFPNPHVIIFSNYPPTDLSEVSADRWVIKQIVDNDIDL